MRLHATEIISAWIQKFPADEIVIVGPKWVDDAFGTTPNIVVRRWPNETAFSRAVGQMFFTAYVAARLRIDRVISLSPIVSPLVPRSRSICFEHDWRHKKVAGEFGRAQHLYRKLWEISAARAGAVVCISEKAEQETLNYVKAARTIVIPNGFDHARSWRNLGTRDESRKSIVTFGHHNNKRPELVMDAFAMMGGRFSQNSHLTILGAKGEYQSTLRERAEGLGIQGRVRFPGFVSSDEYESTISSADVIVMASSDEGFGLPVAEAQYFGIPIVVTADSGLVEIHGDGVISAAPSAAGVARVLEVGLNAQIVDQAPTRSERSWDRTAERLRALALGTESRAVGEGA